MKRKDITYLIILILTGLMIILVTVGPNNIYGSETDWLSQHWALPEYFRTLFYKTGNYKVVIKYESPLFKEGVFISGIGIISYIGIIIFDNRKKSCKWLQLFNKKRKLISFLNIHYYR